MSLRSLWKRLWVTRREPRRFYEAAQTTRVNSKHWKNATTTDADSVLLPALDTLRQRCKYELRNSGYAEGKDGYFYAVGGAGYGTQYDYDIGILRSNDGIHWEETPEKITENTVPTPFNCACIDSYDGNIYVLWSSGRISKFDVVTQRWVHKPCGIAGLTPDPYYGFPWFQSYQSMIFFADYIWVIGLFTFAGKDPSAANICRMPIF